MAGACQQQGAKLPNGKWTAHTMNPSLDQLIADLAALYEAETGYSASSHCYRDVTVEDEFNGKFFLMTKVFLEELAPNILSTPIALGKRIHRVLQDK